MPETNQPDADAMFQFACHVCGVCATAILTLALDAAHPNDPTPLALLPLTAITRQIETICKTEWRISGIVLHIALGNDESRYHCDLEVTAKSDASDPIPHIPAAP